MGFEFDQHKSAINKNKHGIDFLEAQALWKDPNVVTVPIEVDIERRFMIIGTIDGKYWSAVVTYRSENVRLISVRRSRRNEVKIYEKAQKI